MAKQDTIRNFPKAVNNANSKLEKALSTDNEEQMYNAYNERGKAIKHLYINELRSIKQNVQDTLKTKAGKK